jgi:hypothetical protein
MQQDLIPLLIQYAGFPNGKDLKADREAKATWRMLYALLKLMCQMTMPAMLTFDGADDGVEKTHEFAQQVDFLRHYKVAMSESWNMLATEQDLANGRGRTYSTPAALEALLKILYMSGALSPHPPNTLPSNRPKHCTKIICMSWCSCSGALHSNAGLEGCNVSSLHCLA